MGGGRADFDLTTVPGTKVFESEQDFAMTLVNGRYRLFNNTWNRGASSGRHRQKIFVTDDNGKTLMGWAWKWKDSSGVATYPEIQVGHSPWNGEAAEGSGFPFQVGSKKLTASYDIGLAATGSYNLAFEFWVVSALPPSKDTISHEVMVWIAGERLAASGSEIDKVTLQGNTFSVNMRKNHGDASGGSSNTWTIVTFIAERPMLHGPLDFGPLIDYLVQRGHVRTSAYIANLELGNEVMRGSGTTVVRNYAVTVE
jgi:hypothetical protein